MLIEERLFAAVKQIREACEERGIPYKFCTAGIMSADVAYPDDAPRFRVNIHLQDGRAIGGSGANLTEAMEDTLIKVRGRSKTEAEMREILGVTS